VTSNHKKAVEAEGVREASSPLGLATRMPRLAESFSVSVQAINVPGRADEAPAYQRTKP